MNIDKLIEELINLKSCGVENIAIIDSNNKDLEMTLEMNGESDLAFMVINPITEE
jgi:hypothetical protein